MTKKEAAELFGNQQRLAEALNVTPQAISQWPDELDQARSDRVVGAAARVLALSQDQLRQLTKNRGASLVITPGNPVAIAESDPSAGYVQLNDNAA